MSLVLTMIKSALHDSGRILFFEDGRNFVTTERTTTYVERLAIKGNKSQYWPRGAPNHFDTNENEKA